MIMIIIIINICCNFQQSHSSQHLHREAPEVYRFEERVNRNMASENDLYNTISTTHNWYYPEQITQQFKFNLLNPYPANVENMVSS
jgi:hypothetical protein